MKRGVPLGWVNDARAALAAGQRVNIRPVGNSMRGRIESGSAVTLSPVDPAAVRAGDVVLVAWRGNWLLHLVVEASREKLLIGNALGKVNGWVDRSAVIGRMREGGEGMDSTIRDRIAQHMGCAVHSVERVTGGGYTPAARFRVRLDDGRTLFAKVGTTPLTAGWVRDEARFYAAFEDSSLASDVLARYFGLIEDDEHPVLLLEDLSMARWPHPERCPWQENDIERVFAAVTRIASHRPLPDWLPALAPDPGWHEVARDPAPFLSTGLCSQRWLDAALPTLIAAQDSADLQGDDLLQRDLRSDNLCLLGERAVIVDWNCVARGPAVYDRAFFAQSLRLEGGPSPDEIVPDGAAWSSVVSGFFASRAGLPPIPDAPRVRRFQWRQLQIALNWAVRALALPALDRMPAREALSALDARRSRGELSEEDWFIETEEHLVDAYLAYTDPRAMSGKSGDEIDWRWSRELVLGAVQGDRADILDIGCANGYLMASLARWGAERELHIEPYGLEISERLACLARRQHPQWASRIAVGNALTWTSERRFDVVHTGLDYVPPARQRQLVTHILEHLLRSGGRLVLRPERGGDPAAALESIGFIADGTLTAAHPTTGALRRTAFLVVP